MCSIRRYLAGLCVTLVPSALGTPLTQEPDKVLAQKGVAATTLVQAGFYQLCLQHIPVLVLATERTILCRTRLDGTSASVSAPSSEFLRVHATMLAYQSAIRVASNILQP